MFRVISVLLFPFASWAIDLYSIQLETVPTDGQTCQFRANETAERFAAAARVEIYSTVVLAETKEECTLKFDYAAGAPVARVATITDDVSIYLQGSYKSRKDCESDSASQVALFESQTGLAPWLVYCERTSTRSWNMYQVHVEAIGMPRTPFHVVSGLSFSQPRVGWDVALKEIKEELPKRGVVVASLVSEPIPHPNELVLRYYGVERRWLVSREYAQHDTKLCEPQIGRVREAFANYQPKPLGIYCSRNDVSRDELQFIFLKAGIELKEDLLTVVDPKVYVTLDECRQNLDATETFYRTKLNRKIITGFCAGSEKQLQMHLFEKRITSQ